jgi:hypothetical protein
MLEDVTVINMFKDCMEVTLNRADLHTKCNIRNVFDLFEYAHFNLSIADVVHFCYEERDLWLCIFFKKASMSLHMVVVCSLCCVCCRRMNE